RTSRAPRARDCRAAPGAQTAARGRSSVRRARLARWSQRRTTRTDRKCVWYPCRGQRFCILGNPNNACVAVPRADHPLCAVRVSVRREGAVVLDRAIGHARGNGPRDPADADKVLATPDTPFLIYSGAKAMTAFVVHMLNERKVLDIRRPVADYIPGYDAQNKG